MRFLVPLLLVLASSPISAGSAPKPRKRAPHPTPAVRQEFFVPGVAAAVRPKAGPRAPRLMPFLGAAGNSRRSLPLPAGITALPSVGSAASEAVPYSPLIFGANAVWGDNGTFAGWDRDGGAKARRLAQLMGNAGVTCTRIGIAWGDVERVRGHYDWTETDRFIRFARSLGVTPICVVAVTPTWAVDHSPEVTRLFREKGLEGLAAMRAPDRAFEADLGRFARACAARYRGVIHYWEFWNEPDGMGMPDVVRGANGKPVSIRYGADPRGYARLLHAFSANVKQADPHALVAIGGLQVLRTDYLKGVYGAGGRPFFDAVALHPYQDRKPIALSWIDACHAVMLKNGDARKTVWLTEWGWPTSPGQADAITEYQQTRLLKESFAGIRQRPFVTVACYHTLNDWRTKESDPSTLIAMGLCGRDGRPRPGYYAFREEAVGRPGLPESQAHVRLVAPPSPGEEGEVLPKAVEVAIDASKTGGTVLPDGLAFAAGADAGGPDTLVRAAPKLRDLGTRLIRMDPFPNPDAVTVDVSGELHIDWRYTDAMIDAVARSGVQPMLDFATMPSALASPSSVSRMPRDLTLWARFVQAVVRRYNGEQKRGIRYFELGNEPNAGGFALADWLQLYEAFARAVTTADPSALPGGPAAAAFGRDWLAALANACASRKIPLGFLSWHAYNQAPARYLTQVREARGILGAHPELKGTRLMISEWNASAGPSPANDGLYAATHAASVVEQLIDEPDVTCVFYSVQDGQNLRDPGAMLNGRWGVLTRLGAPKPVYNAFALLQRLAGGTRVNAGTSSADVHSLAVRQGDRVRVLFWRCPPQPEAEAPVLSVPTKGPDQRVTLRVSGIPWNGATRCTQWQIDANRSNLAAGAALGDLQQVAAFDASAGALNVETALPCQGMAMIELAPAPASAIALHVDSPRAVVYGGETFPVTVTVGNRGSSAKTVGVTVGSTDKSLTAGAHAISVAVPAGGERPVRLVLRAPAGTAAAQQFITVRAGDAETAVAVRFAPAVVASLPAVPTDLPTVGDTRIGVIPTGTVAVRLVNRSRMAVRAVLTACGASTLVTLPARKSVVARMKVTAPSAAPGTYGLPVTVKADGVTILASDVRVCVPVVCRRAPSPIRVDGVLGEWGNAVGVAMVPSTVLSQKVADPADLSARMLTAWDDRCLYLSAVVNDDVQFQPFPPADMKRADCLVVALDPRRGSEMVASGQGPYPVEIGFAVGRPRPVAYQFSGSGGAGVVSAAQVAILREGSRTVYEVALPWSILGKWVPRPGSTIGIAAAVFDSDGMEPKAVEWGGGIVGGSDPHAFAGLQLAP